MTHGQRIQNELFIQLCETEMNRPTHNIYWTDTFDLYCRIDGVKAPLAENHQAF
jgi:hypothetical protein